jgi:CBS-domain-containing membrane protein
MPPDAWQTARMSRVPPRAGLLFASIGCAAAVLVVAGTAWVTRQPCLAPPLGATTLLCFRSPGSPVASPRNILVGHALALLCGWLALLVTGSRDASAALQGGFTAGDAWAAALALGLTVAATEGLGFPHPPAGATTLVVSLGLMRGPGEFAAFELGAALVAACAWSAHRARGRHYPRWSVAEPG